MFALSLPAVACGLLLGMPSSPLALAIAALLIGLAAGAELDVIAFLTSRYFGMRSFGEIYGVQLMFFAVGSGAFL